MLLQVSHVSRQFAGRDVLHDVTFQLDRGDRVGVVGENGTGKTTFLNILAGELAVDSGTVTRKRELRLGYVEQLASPPADQLAGEYVRHGDERIIAMEARLKEIETHGADDPAELDRLLHEFDMLGGYRYAARITEILGGLGIEHLVDRPMGEISGGELRRVQLGRVFASVPDVLLLDEPTNHLDIYAVKWLEQYLAGLDAALVMVSHDRYLLDQSVNRILFCHAGKWMLFPGNFTAAMGELKAATERNRKLYEKQQQFKEKEMEFIRRNIEGQKTKQAQGRRTRLEKTDWLDRDLFQNRSFGLTFKDTGRRNKELLSLDALVVGYDEPVVSGISRLIRRGDRLGVVGRNGSGKSTVLRALAGIQPALSGRVKPAEGLQVGYFDQDAALPIPGGTVREQILAVDDLLRYEELAGYLARFYFFAHDLDKPVSVLSGGERSRLKLAVLMRTEIDLLIMDEPTNHLDLQLKESLTEALRMFNGSLLVVSHDRFFLDHVVDEVLGIRDGEPRWHLGTVSEYLVWEAEQDELSDKRKNISSVSETPQQDSEKSAVSGRISKNELKRARWRLEEVESRIGDLEEEKEDLNRQMVQPDVYSDGDAIQRVRERLQTVEAELDALMTEWENLQEQCM